MNVHMLCDRCASVRLLTLNCLLVSPSFFLKHTIPRMFIIESQRQYPLAAFNMPARRFSPWQKALDSAFFNICVTIWLFVLISCTSEGVALFGSNVSLLILMFEVSFKFSHVPRLLCFLLSILGVNSVEMLSLLLVCILVFPVDSLFSNFPVCLL